jgi:hypothetical protein
MNGFQLAETSGLVGKETARSFSAHRDDTRKCSYSAANCRWLIGEMAGWANVCIWAGKPTTAVTARLPNQRCSHDR